MLPVKVLLLASWLVQAARPLHPEERQWVRCLMTIATRYFPAGRSVAMFRPSVGHSAAMADIGEHLLKETHAAGRWPLILCTDTDNTTEGRVSLDNECISYIVFVPCDEVKSKLWKIISHLDFRHMLMPSWNIMARFVIVVANNCIAINARKLSQQILSVVWIYKLVNVVVVIQDDGSSGTELNVSTAIGVRSLGHVTLALYTWFPYQGQHRCTKVEDVVLLDVWAMAGNGHFLRKSDIFPQKIGARFNGCPLTAIARSFPNMVEYKPSMGRNSDPSRPLYKEGWEIRLFRIITNSLNMTETYLPSPSSFEVQNQILDAVQSLVSGQADIVFGGVESRARWAWQDYIDTTNSYFTRRIRWYVPCAFKHPKWNSIFRIFSRQLWFCVMASLAVISFSVTLIARFESNYSKVYWTVTSSFTCAWAVLLGVTAPALPRTNSVRLVFIAWLSFSFDINAMFQSILTTFLTDSGYLPPIGNMDQMLASKIKYGYNPLFDCVYNESDDVHSSVILRNRVLCPIHAICVKWAYVHKNISLILDELSMEERYSGSSLMDENSKPLLCPLEDGVVMYGDSVMLMRVGDPLLERINEIIDRVVEAGIFMQWKKSHLERMKLRARAIGSYSPLNTYYGFAMKHMQPAFYLLLMGYVLSTSAFFIEIAYCRVRHLKRSRTVTD
jgi:hypothetical protein